MFGFIKNFFGKSEEASEAPLTAAPTPPSPPAASAGSPAQTHRPTSSGGDPGEALPPPVRSRGKMERVLIPLKAITDTFPRDLQPLIANPPAATVMVAFQVVKLTSQLAQGKVEVSIGDLRKIAPVSTFTHDTSCDGEKVQIPLKELATRLNPSALQRGDQREVELPGSIDNVFVKRGETPPPPAPEAPVIPEAPAAPPTPAPLSAESMESPRPAEPPTLTPPEPLIGPATEPASLPEETTAPSSSPAPSLSSAGGLKFTPPPESNFLAESEPAPEIKLDRGLAFNPSPAPPAPVTPPAETSSLPATPAIAAPALSPAAKAPEAAPTPAPSPAPAPTEAPPPAPRPAPVSRPAPAPAPATVHPPAARSRQPLSDPSTPVTRSPQPASSPATAPSSPQATAASILSLPLDKISANWSGAIRASLANLPPEATLELPLGTVGEALKKGKIALPWSTVRAAIRPALPPASGHDDETLLTLPLNIVAPLFMAAGAPATAGARSRKVTIDESIPSPFSTARPDAEASDSATGASPSGEGDGAAVPVAARRPAAKGGTLGFEGRLPSELVERACSLAGVAGAVIALKEGLLVAAKLPPEFTQETLGAFLPQLFGRVEETMENMQIGPLQNLMFTAGDRPWQIWKVGNAFFAAMGRPNELLPGSQLKIIAAQLARHTRG